MLRPGITFPILVALLTAACASGAPTEVTVTGNKKATPKPADSAIASRAVELRVFAPAGLVAAGGGNLVAAGGGNIKNQDRSGLASADGFSMTSNGSALVAAGGGNLMARLPMFKLQTAIEKFLPVEDAVVFFADLSPEGKPISKVAGASGPDGAVRFNAVEDKALAAVALFKLDGKTYRLSAIVPKGKQSVPTMVDPINTIVEGRIRKILSENGKIDTGLALDKLREVWTIFNDANVEIDASDLENGKSIDDITTFYNKYIEKVPETERPKIVDYMKLIREGK